MMKVTGGIFFRAWTVVLLACAAILSGCGSEPSLPGVSVSGTVVQGPVSNATVWADRITTAFPQGNTIQDPDEVFTVTDDRGVFLYKNKPDYAYISRSKGGIDTITSQPALPMAAPAGATTITPITTVIAAIAPNADGTTSTAQESLITKIESIMGNQQYDADPTKQVTPAALALTKAVEVALTVANNAVAESATTSGGSTATQLAQTQAVVSTAVVTAIATELAKPATTTATLSNAAALATTVATATQAAADTLTANSATTNVAFYDTATIASSVNTAVEAVATEIAEQSGQTAASMGTTAATFVKEATIIQAINDEIATAINVAAATTTESVAVVAPPVVADTTPPAVLSRAPAAGATGVPVKSSIAITFSKAMDPATLVAGNFAIAGETGTAAVTPTISYNSLTNTATLTPNADLAAGKLYTVTISSAVLDLSANLPVPSTSRTWSFTTAAVVDTVPPTVTVAPATGATSVPRGATVTATFDKGVTPATVNTTNFTLKKGTQDIPGVVRYDSVSRVATFIPALPLDYATAYTVSLKSITSTSGIAIVPVTTTFTTLASPDTVKPTATLSVVPGATNGRIATGAEFVATFSEPIDITTLNTTSFSLKFKSTGLPIAGSILYNAVTRTATFTPNAALPQDRIVVLTVTTAITDIAGNSLASQTSQEFTTVAPVTGSTGGTI